MPQKPRRPSAANADSRPSFARPPGVRGVPSQPPATANASPSPTRPRVRERDPDEWSDEESEYNEQRKRSQRLATSKRPRQEARNSSNTSPVKKPSQVYGRDREREKHKRKTSEPPASYDRSADRERHRAKYSSGTSTNSGTQLLSTSALSKLNTENDLADFAEKRKARKKREKQYKELAAAGGGENAQRKKRRKNRDVSGAILEEGRSGGKRKRKDEGGGSGGYGYYDEFDEKREVRQSRKQRQPMSKKKKKWLIIGGIAMILLIIIIVAGVVASKNKSKGRSSGSSSSSSSNSATPSNTCSTKDVPTSAKGTYYDISTWLDTSDFNCTYTAETVGGLPIMGLNSAWDDSAQANSNVPALNKKWQYGTMPVRGTNIGGWLNLEPFITPSMFNFAASANVVDEWTLCQNLGSNCASTMEQHYATFITKSDFAAIQAAGLDHVRIPYGYWAVTTYDGDPYVKQISWRYLLRAIEWAREYGLRVNLDLHGVPGSQNGWAHSGHQGSINWLNGANGDLNGQRSLDIHNQLSQFFAQPRYKNVVTFYGLVNEPKMISMDTPSKVITWNEQAISLVRANGITQQIVFGDGFLALTAWNSTMKSTGDSALMLDTHQYQIFDVGQLKLTHANRINLACSGWTGIMTVSNSNATGWGPTINGEWSQADTDCTPNLNNLGAGSRWAGTLNTPTVNVTTPSCASPPCSCAPANADPSTYTASYKTFLKMYAEAQMHSFEQAQGWFYWTWKTESATQWSWKLGMAAGILPVKAYQPSFRCDSTVPDFGDLSESY